MSNPYRQIFCFKSVEKTGEHMLLTKIQKMMSFFSHGYGIEQDLKDNNNIL